MRNATAALPYDTCAELGNLPVVSLDAAMPKETPVPKSLTPTVMGPRRYKIPPASILSNVTARMLEKGGLENLSRNIPSIASACVTWQNVPKPSALTNGLGLLGRFGNLLSFPPFPEDQQHMQRGEAAPVSCPGPPDTEGCGSACCQLSERQLTPMWVGREWCGGVRLIPNPAAFSLPTVPQCPALGSPQADR